MKVWSVILAGIAAAESLSKATGCPTPSACAREHKALTWTVGGYTLAHLTGLLPYRLDLFRRLT